MNVNEQLSEVVDRLFIVDDNLQHNPDVHTLHILDSRTNTLGKITKAIAVQVVIAQLEKDISHKVLSVSTVAKALASNDKAEKSLEKVRELSKVK
jgi:uncharacterized Rmd1/YagE family protein